MGKSRAEIQKAYRQRLKQKDNEGYLAKERKRRRETYVPSANLSKRELRERNDKNRERLRRFYERKKQRQLENVEVQDTSGYETGESQLLQVKIPFINRKNGPQKRWKNELKKAKARIRELEHQKNETTKKFKTIQRKLQRYKHKTPMLNREKMTPRKETEAIMEAAKLTPQQKEAIRKPLFLGNVIAEEVKATKSKTKPTQKKAIHRMVSGKIVKKYRCVAALAAKTGLSRHGLSKVNSKLIQITRNSRINKRRRFQQKVIEFMEREDNSRSQPGKKDVKKTETGEKSQTRVLTDYLENLYQKYKSENPAIDISLTTFKRCRPKNILLTSFINRHTCLCTKHQNMALTAKALKAAGLDVPVNPEHLLKETIVEKADEHLKTDEPFKINQWKRIEVEEKGKKKYVTKIVEISFNKATFLDFLKKQLKDFEEHVVRVATQYEQIRTLREHLPPHHVIIQMDFAENYACKSLDEVQSAYFNQTSVTLHPIVIYYNGDDGRLEHKSFIVVSDEMAHKSSTVLAFIDDIMPLLKGLDTSLSTVHYWTDSPTSQYRNKYIFDFVANHHRIHGVRARWNYFESGHGKGPCDGLGGTCKRLADEAMRSGRVLIQDAKSFFEWAKSSSMKSVTFRYVAAATCEEKCKDIEQYQSEVKAIKGTMKVHSVVGLDDSNVKIRDTSCYCSDCLNENVCDNWRQDVTRTVTRDLYSTDETTATLEINGGNEQKVKHNKGDFVAAKYDRAWYLGKVLDFDDDDEEYEITFMEKRKELYRWPQQSDRLWIPEKDVICRIDEPIPTGKSGRLFRLSENSQREVAKLLK